MSNALQGIERVYLVGIGGIGMSALARYYAHHGLPVAGYDAQSTPLTDELKAEGIPIHFTDSTEHIPAPFRTENQGTLVVYTPAVPSTLGELEFFRSHGYRVIKRAQALGEIVSASTVAGIAGTHGKTSTSTLLAYLLAQTAQGCSAFLGGISKNFGKNLVVSDRNSDRLVVEADEFDRSFLNLSPSLALITSMDADHLEIYGDHERVQEAYGQYVGNLLPQGVLIVKRGLEPLLAKWIRPDIRLYTYSLTDRADFYAHRLTHNDGFYRFDLYSPYGIIPNLELGIPGLYNLENAVAASAAALVWGISHPELAQGLATFQGVKRRFDVQYHSPSTIYIDDYAHHPEELRGTIGSARAMFGKRRITGVFQPHLYTRTRDFANEFAKSLGLLDEVILTDIYPAREAPIPGITSAMLLERTPCPNKMLCPMERVVNELSQRPLDVLITMGAGSIDRLTNPIVEMLKAKEDEG